MEVLYKKDLKHNYMVIIENDGLKLEPYCIRMLEQRLMEGILPFELRHMDNNTLFYYEITGKQAMINLFDKTALSYGEAKQLITSILTTLETAYDHLLPEDDFILTPEFIYLDIVTNLPSLCFLSGYKKNSKEQMSSLLEYLMNKVDYNDKEAVLLVYQLYAISREEGFTFEHIYDVLNNQKQSESRVKDTSSKEKAGANKRQSNDGVQDSARIQNNESIRKNQGIPIKGARNPLINAKEEYKVEPHITGDSTIPVMMERLEGEEEVLYYPFITYLYTGICAVAGIALIVLGFTTGIIYNSFGNRVEYSKLFALLLMVFCGDGYLMKKIWDKKNKTTKMVATKEYIDPRLDLDTKEAASGLRTRITGTEEKYTVWQQEQPHQDHRTTSEQHNFHADAMRVDLVQENNMSRKQEIILEEKDNNPTCLLNEKIQLTEEKQEIKLKSKEEDRYQSIHITEFPFFIGKLKKNVDYCLEKDVVSRFHAKITKEGETYYITDLNSTNGTFVNQKALQTYERQEIRQGDEIAFANLKYEFII